MNEKMNYTSRALDELTLEATHANFTNPRSQVERQRIKDLAESIRQNGLEYPLLVWEPPDESGEKVCVVVDGGRRLRALQLLVNSGTANGFEKDVPVRVVSADDANSARVKALISNLERENLSSYDTAVTIQAMRNEGMQQKDIAAKINRSGAWVSRQLKAIDNGSEAVINAWREGKLPDDDVQTLSNMTVGHGRGVKPNHEEQDKHLEEILALRGANGSSAPVKKSQRIAARAKVTDLKRGKSGKVRPARPGVKSVEVVANTTENAKSAYVRGLHDMARYVLGQIGVTDFDETYANHIGARGAFTTDAEPPKRKRGRPPKVKPEDAPEPPKRKRGRPPKVKPEDAPEPPKRKRGRPRKVKPEDVAEPPKRKRGRPRKSPETTSASARTSKGVKRTRAATRKPSVAKTVARKKSGAS